VEIFCIQRRGQASPAKAPPFRPARSRRTPSIAGGGGAGSTAGTLSPSMDLRRLGAGEWLAGISGLALLASLFLPWYEVSGTATGWESLTAIDVVLALVAISGVLLAIVTATQRVPAVTVALSALISLFGSVGVILVLLRVLDIPDWAGGREWALWLGLAGAVGIVAGALLAMRDEVRPGAARVEIEPIPAPRP
jgi:hypothetical protein